MDFVEKEAPEYLNSGWPLLDYVTLCDLLPTVFCVQFIFGPHLSGSGSFLAVHFDPACPTSTVSSRIIVSNEAKNFGEPVRVDYSWGYGNRGFISHKYIKTFFEDDQGNDLRMEIDLAIIDVDIFKGYNWNRIVLGRDFVERYVKSKRGTRGGKGGILFGNDITYWATTYTEKTKGI